MEFVLQLAGDVRDGKCTVAQAVNVIRERYDNLFTRRDRVGDLRHELRRIGVDEAEDAKLTSEETDEVVMMSNHNLQLASENVIDVEALPLLAFARRVLSDSQSDIIDTVIAIGVATGRRMVEVALKGRFEYVNDDTLRFRGQAKKRIDVDAYEIPTLAPAAHVVAAHVRVLRYFDGVTPYRLNSSYSPKINRRIRNMFVSLSEGAHFHTFRMMYGIVTFETCRPHTLSLNAWVSKTLGHCAIGNSIFYTKLRVVDLDVILLATKMNSMGRRVDNTKW